MQFLDQDDGDYRIYAGSMELGTGRGFIGAVVVQHLGDGVIAPHVVYRDLALSCGYRWQSSAQALNRALADGQGAVKAAECLIPSRRSVSTA